MPNALTDGALSGAGPMAGQGPQVDAAAMQTPPAAPPQGIDIKEVYDVLHKQETVDRKFRTLLETGGPIARKNVTQAAVELVAERVMPAQAMAAILADLPEDPQQIREWVEQHAKTIEDQLQQLLTLVHGTEDPTHPMDAFGPPEGEPATSPQQVQ